MDSGYNIKSIKKSLSDLDVSEPGVVGRFYVVALVTGLSLSLSKVDFKYMPSIKQTCVRILYGHIPTIFNIVQDHRKDMMIELGVLLRKGPRMYRKSALRELASYGEDK